MLYRNLIQAAARVKGTRVSAAAGGKTFYWQGSGDMIVF